MFKLIIALLCFCCSFFATTASVTLLNQEKFAQEALQAHNIYRSIHNASALALNANLSLLAQKRAQEMSETGELFVKQNYLNSLSLSEPLGETVGSVGGFSDYNGISASQLWYSTVSKFDEEGEMSTDGASFTQLVWKNTTQVGFGIARSIYDASYYFVAEYYPTGNVRGQYLQNVFQLNIDEDLNQEIQDSITTSTAKTTATTTTLASSTTSTTFLANSTNFTTQKPKDESLRNENVLLSTLFLKFNMRNATNKSEIMA
jgi:uncharacterized protein YkwD